MIRSFFFAPANRPDLFSKFPRFGADCCVIDLEDGTPSSEKVAAREALGASIGQLRAAELAGSLLVRVNEPASDLYLGDLAAAFLAGADGVVIPKLEDAEQLQPALHWARQRRSRVSPSSGCIVGGLESVKGVINAVELCRADPSLFAVYFGAEDFIADMGGQRTAEGDEVLFARSQVVLAAKAARVLALDQGVVDIRDDERFRDDARRGRQLGYDGKICVVPRQVALANEIFSPTPEEVAYSRRLVEAHRMAQGGGQGTIEFEGRMIDSPLLKRAERILDFAERLSLKSV